MDSGREKSSLMCPKCGSMNTKIIDLTVLVPVLKCSDCGREWMPSPEGIEAGLSGAGAHPRGSESKGKPAQNPMGVFRTIVLLLIMIAIILGVVIIIYGFP
jgi:DNA-directed RNA polymerase subunit RPC12/RpoP